MPSVAYVAGKECTPSTYDDNVSSCRSDEFDVPEDSLADNDEGADFSIKLGEDHIASSSCIKILSRSPVKIFEKASTDMRSLSWTFVSSGCDRNLFTNLVTLEAPRPFKC